MKKITRLTLAVILAGAGNSFASEAIVNEGSSLCIMLFLGFCALIIFFQLLPGLTLFVNMVRELFRRTPREPADNGSHNSRGPM